MTAHPLIESIGNRLVLHFNTLEDALQLLSPWRGIRHRAEAVGHIVEALSAVGLNVEVKVKGRKIAEVSSGTLRGPIVALLNLPV